VAADRGLELVDVLVSPGRGAQSLRIYVDREGGVGLDDLQLVSEEVAVLLDAEDPIEGAYTLEVSSPGLDRPLRSEVDFRRCAGRLVRATTLEAIEGRSEWSGRVVSAEDGMLVLRLADEGDPTVALPISAISHARQEVGLPSRAGARLKKRKRKRARRIHG
jgi:ribosome maturation factor RimP